MAINKKLIHFKNKSTFLSNLEAGNILDTSIVFIQDAKQIWTHGTLYDANDAKIYYTSLYFKNITDESALSSSDRSEINHIIELVSTEDYIIYYGYPYSPNGTSGYVSGILDVAWDGANCAFRVSQPDGSINVYQPNGTIAAATTWKVTNIPVGGGDSKVYTTTLNLSDIIQNNRTTMTSEEAAEIDNVVAKYTDGYVVVHAPGITYGAGDYNGPIIINVSYPDVGFTLGGIYNGVTVITASMPYDDVEGSWSYRIISGDRIDSRGSHVYSSTDTVDVSASSKIDISAGTDSTIKSIITANATDSTITLDTYALNIVAPVVEVSGDMTVTGSVSASSGFFDTSDAKVKTNVRELNAINADAIKLVEFDRTDIEHHGYGVIAQEVEKVYPSVVNTDADGFKSVNYNEIAMIKIKSLEDKVARLEALVARLESKLS